MIAMVINIKQDSMGWMGRLVCRAFDVIAGVLNISPGTADSVAAACAEKGDQCGCQQQQNETLL